MSFSGTVKKELAAIVPEARHCQIAELAAFAQYMEPYKNTDSGEGKGCFLFRTEREDVADLLFTLFKRAFNMDVVLSREERRSPGTRKQITVRVEDPARVGAFLEAVSHSSVLRLECCRRSFIRGAFLAAGSISDPERSYHLEFTAENSTHAEKLQNILRKEGFDAHTVLRKKEWVVYLKESDQIVDLLGEMGAGISFLNIENIRVTKQVRGNVNRKVNCETANLGRTVRSSLRQLEDIRYIRAKRGFGDLTPALREMAEVRLDHPDAPLSELGALMNPRIGKSGVNHRLRKLSAYAEELRSKESDQHMDTSWRKE